MSTVVAITGASKGIGATLAYACAKQGYSLVLVARSEADLQAVCKKCKDIYTENNFTTSDVIYVVGDVSKRSTFQTMMSECLAKFTKLDVLVNNAGLGITKSTLTVTEEEFDLIMGVNTKSVLFGMQEAIHHFMRKERPVGQIINVSSMLGRVPSAAQRSVYCAAKHAVNSLTATMREEMCDQGYAGILVCGFHPGVVGTDFGLNAKNGGGDNRHLPDVQDVEEVAQVILSQIQNGLALMQKEIENIKTPEKEEGEDIYNGSTKFESDVEGVFDVYSRPSYKQDVIDYFSAKDMCTHERRKRAAYKDAFLLAAAKRARQASEDSK